MLASLGVFLRDVGQTIVIITTVMMFLSPVFYPLTGVPEKFRPIIMANPLTFIIGQAREVLIWGHLPNWMGLGIYTLAATSLPGQVTPGSRRPERGLPMSSEIAIRIQNLSKCYQIYATPRDRLKQFVLPPLSRMMAQNTQTIFWRILGTQ